ncbi:hypothetical protein PIB30_074835 [Stylosanthes scabra]|uniref:Uncharacterized protein n=1 Tax=Stylosanthes scabra TaxID=79078 RepID=A0ABU6WSX4_9FABA|nr:hypothetical protein [Stylosanthes scabra]
MRMIPTPGSRVQSSETSGSCVQRQTPTQTHSHTPTEDDEPPPLEPDPMSWSPVDNTLSEGENEDITAEEALAAEAGRIYLCGNIALVNRRLSCHKHPHRVRYLPRPTQARRIVCRWTSEKDVNRRRGWKKSVRPSLTLVSGPTFDRQGGAADTNCGRPQEGGIYGMGMVPSHSYPPLFRDPDDDDTATSPPDLREKVTLLNMEISQQAEAHAQRLQSQEVSELRKAYSEMYSFLTEIRSSRSSSATMPPPPPPAQSQSPPPQPYQGTIPLHSVEDEPDYF